MEQLVSDLLAMSWLADFPSLSSILLDALGWGGGPEACNPQIQTCR